MTDDSIELPIIADGEIDPPRLDAAIALALDAGIYPALVDEWDELQAGEPLSTLTVDVFGLVNRETGERVGERHLAKRIIVWWRDHAFSVDCTALPDRVRERIATERRAAITIAAGPDELLEQEPQWLVATFDIDTSGLPDLSVNDPDPT